MKSKIKSIKSRIISRIDKLPPHGERGLRLMKLAVCVIVVIVIFASIFASILYFEPYESAIIRGDMLREYGWDFLKEENYEMAGVDVIDRIYVRGGGSEGVINVYTLSSPTLGGIYGGKPMEIAQKIVGDFMLNLLVQSEGIEELSESINGNPARVTYLTCSFHFPLIRNIEGVGKVKFLIVLMDLEKAKVIGSVVVVIIGYVVTEIELTGRGIKLYSLDYESNYEELYDLVHRGFSLRS